MRNFMMMSLLALSACSANSERTSDDRPSAPIPEGNSAMQPTAVGAGKSLGQIQPGSEKGREMAAFIESEGRKLVLAQLRDPDSAKFTDVEVRWSSGRPTLCGYVNSRNGFGGMTGAQRFITAGSDFAVLEEQMRPGEMEPVWQQFCQG